MAIRTRSSRNSNGATTSTPMLQPTWIEPESGDSTSSPTHYLTRGRKAKGTKKALSHRKPLAKKMKSTSSTTRHPPSTSSSNVPPHLRLTIKNSSPNSLSTRHISRAAPHAALNLVLDAPQTPKSKRLPAGHRVHESSELYAELVDASSHGRLSGCPYCAFYDLTDRGVSEMHLMTHEEYLVKYEVLRREGVTAGEVELHKMSCACSDLDSGEKFPSSAAFWRHVLLTPSLRCMPTHPGLLEEWKDSMRTLGKVTQVLQTMQAHRIPLHNPTQFFAPTSIFYSCYGRHVEMNDSIVAIAEEYLTVFNDPCGDNEPGLAPLFSLGDEEEDWGLYSSVPPMRTFSEERYWKYLSLIWEDGLYLPH